jgi:hypothetical protein
LPKVSDVALGVRPALWWLKRAALLRLISILTLVKPPIDALHLLRRSPVAVAASIAVTRASKSSNSMALAA